MNVLNLGNCNDDWNAKYLIFLMLRVIHYLDWINSTTGGQNLLQLRKRKIYTSHKEIE